MSTAVAITVGSPPPTFEERARNAAEEGDVEALYGLIREKPGFLKDIDEMEFVDSPLHTAAAAGRTKFAMELACLKPSFLTKLNQDGLSPIHLALRNEHTDTVLSLLKFDKNLPRLKGKNCYTPFHYVVKKGDLVILKKILMDCPECIHDVTNHDETALHLAARYNNLGALRVLLNWLWIFDHSPSESRISVKSKNKDGDTLLHIAASNKQPKIIRFLVKTLLPIHWKATNSINLTPLDILKCGNQQEIKECVDILCNNDIRATFIMFFSYNPLFLVFSHMAYEIRNMSDDRINALLVATVLILTATYQAALSPPGGVFQPNSPPDQHSTASLQIHSGTHKTSTLPLPTNFTKSPFTSGSSVLSTAHFLSFFIPNIAAFCISLFVTCFTLISILPGFLSMTLVLSLSMLLACLLVSALMIISPNSLSLNIMFNYVFYLIYILYGIILVALVLKLGRILQKRRYMRNITDNES